MKKRLLYTRSFWSSNGWIGNKSKEFNMP